MQFKFMKSLAFLRSSTVRRSSTRCYATANTTPVVLADRLVGLNQPTVWHEFSPLAVQHGAVNLGQGFPDWQPPEFVLQAMERSLHAPRAANQYARSAAQ